MTERLTGIIGPMFSGKTQELIRLVDRAKHAGVKFQIFKPDIDRRWDKTHAVRSHSGSEQEAQPVKSPREILENLKPDTKLVAIDEVQFFSDEIVGVVEELLGRDIKVIFAGLPQDFRGEGFGSVPQLLLRANPILTLTAICTYQHEDGVRCAQEATMTQRFVNGKPADFTDPVVLVGAEESYAPRCPNHHIIPGKPSSIRL